jgi:hypothetical protein
MYSFQVCPPEIADCQYRGFLEGDHKNGKAKGSSLSTLVERISKLLKLNKLLEGKPSSALNVLQAFTNILLRIALPLHLTMT